MPLRVSSVDVGAARNYPRGTELIAQGSPPRAVWILEDGLIKLVHTERDGRESIVGLRFPGSYLGVAAALLCTSSPLSAIAVTTCRVRQLSSERFLALLRTDADLSWRMHQQHGRELVDHSRRLAELACVAPRRRLEHLLHELAATQATSDTAAGVGFHLPLSRAELGQLIAVSREHVSRLLRQLHDDGVIRLHNRSVFIPRFQPLAGRIVVAAR